MFKMNRLLLVVLIVLLLTVSMTNLISAAETNDSDVQERMELIRASQPLEKKKNKYFSSKFGMFLTNYGTGDNGEVNLGMRVQINTPQNHILFNNTDWKYAIEGVYLKNEDDLAAFFSLQRLFPAIKFTPYFGFGKEITGKANYQLFTGLNFTNNFFGEIKYINQDDLEKSRIYSVAGYQIEF